MSDLIEITDEPRHSCPYGCEGDCDVPEHLRGQRDYFARVAELAQEQIERLRAALDQGGSDECETSAPENASNEGAHVTPDAVSHAERERATDAESRKAGPQPEVGRESSGHCLHHVKAHIEGRDTHE